MGELEQLRDAGVQYLVFIDDTFNVPLPRFKKLLRAMIERRFPFRWISFVRCTNADDETFDLMAKSGCIAVFLGIESGDQTVLNYMASPPASTSTATASPSSTARGIATYASIICGFPGETRESVMNTIRFIEETAPTFYNVQLYYHDIRTPIHAEAKKHGIQSAGYSWSHATMDWKEAAGWVEYMYRNHPELHPAHPLWFQHLVPALSPSARASRSTSSRASPTSRASPDRELRRAGRRPRPGDGADVGPLPCTHGAARPP